MPVKKKVKKAVKKKAAKTKARKTTPGKKVSSRKKAREEKVSLKAQPEKPVAVVEEPPEPEIEKPPEKAKKEKLGIDCEHCDATGVCAAGAPYDKSHGQMFGARIRMTSCIDCLLAAGEHSNSKKLVKCRICDGDGKM